eukprot:CAMPEP_0168338912 /NCGR_PEP_ID=MMETSP0213-20121227/13146_1 /TAXON_ID=151035 /ORGANISM="Euplotes harpa, Strain FSP1.4" /LENGTH=156 /DNA_ID=CAMNT_0008344839 /DNA_START=116 /DNA_END=586 /DNA_ORIENTATION=+
MISSGKLYEANFEEQLGADEKANEAINFFTNYQGKTIVEKHDLIDAQNDLVHRIDTIDINERLNVSRGAIKMLEQVDSIDFDVFKFKQETQEQEMLVLTSHLMDMHGLFKSFKMNPEIYFKFIKRVQDHYNPSFIEYHNKTHGTDLCQTAYFFLKT